MVVTLQFLIDQIFSRHREMPSDVRVLTAREFVALRGMMAKEESNGNVRAGLGGSLIWMAPGSTKYVLTEDRATYRHTLTRMTTAEAAAVKGLFD